MAAVIDAGAEGAVEEAVAARPRRPLRSPLRRAWQLLRASHGTAPIGAVAREVGWSERHLTRQFRTEIGLTPKTAARVIRFDRARHLVRAAARCSAAARTTHADIAARCGYTDQSHLVRDFVDFTGHSPRGWLAAEVGNRQVTAPGDGRD